MTQQQVRARFIKYNPGVRRLGKKGYWYRCAHCGKWCGRPGSDNISIKESDRMEVDHIRPWSMGGSDEMYNLQPLCRPCNRSKSNSNTLGDGIKMLGNDLMHGDFIQSSIRKGVRQNKILKGLGITKRR